MFPPSRASLDYGLAQSFQHPISSTIGMLSDSPPEGDTGQFGVQALAALIEKPGGMATAGLEGADQRDRLGGNRLVNYAMDRHHPMVRHRDDRAAVQHEQVT